MVDILKTNILNKIGKCMLILFVGIVLGYIALVVVYLLPTDVMEQHVRESRSMLEEEGINPVLIDGYKSTRLDNYSDGLILNSAIYNGEESVWEKAAAIYQYRYGEKDYYVSLLRYLDGEPGTISTSYERDWHGYLVYVKPLLLFLNYADIRMVNMAMQILLVGVLLYSMIKKRLGDYIPAFIMALIFLTWNILFYSIEYSAMFYLFVAASLYAVNKNDKLIAKNHVPEYFLIIGMIAGYIDVLTYPILTIGIPLVFLFLLNKEWSENYTSVIGNIATASFWWLCGYGGMWAGKWVVASIVLKSNVLKEAILMALYRMSKTSGESGKLVEFTIKDVFSLNFGVFFKPVFIVALVIFGVWILVKIYREKAKFTSTTMVPFLIIAMMPIVWYLAIGNHSYIHHWMTHRNIVLLVFAICAMLIKVTKGRNGECPEK